MRPIFSSGEARDVTEKALEIASTVPAERHQTQERFVAIRYRLKK